MLGDVVAGSPGLGPDPGHGRLLYAPREAASDRDVTPLAALVAPGQQQDELAPAPRVVHAVAGSAVDAEFGDPSAHRRAVARIPGGEAFDAGEDASSSMQVTESVDPGGEQGRLAALHDGRSVAYRLQSVKGPAHWFSVHRPHQGLDGRTPDEVHIGECTRA